MIRRELESMRKEIKDMERDWNRERKDMKDSIGRLEKTMEEWEKREGGEEEKEREAN